MLEVFTVLILLSNFLLLSLLCLLLLSERAMPESDDYEVDVTNDEINHVDESGEAESKSNERLLIEIMYEETETVKEWLVPIISGFLDIDMNELRDRIIKLFGLPRYSELDLRYYDKDGLLTTITDDNDLEDIMMQKMEHLKIYVRIINSATTKQVEGVGLEPICTSKPTNSSAPPESDLDDWLIT